MSGRTRPRAYEKVFLFTAAFIALINARTLLLTVSRVAPPTDAVTVSAAVIVSTKPLPSVPVTVIVVVPVTAFPAAVSVKVELPEPPEIDGALNDAVTPEGKPETVNAGVAE